jgi:hypothetical protein
MLERLLTRRQRHKLRVAAGRLAIPKSSILNHRSSAILRVAARVTEIRPGAIHENPLLLAADLKHHARADHLVAGELARDGMQKRVA